jgi:hypothetical protein
MLNLKATKCNYAAIWFSANTKRFFVIFLFTAIEKIQEIPQKDSNTVFCEVFCFELIKLGIISQK